MPEAIDYGRRFAIFAAVLGAVVSALPMIFGVLLAPAGTEFLGYPYATDDHMVYAAWMRQAQEGRFFFDNRFAIDAQPGLTIHLYFFVLGLFSKATGIAWATTISKSIFSGLFVWLLYRIVRKLSPEPFAAKLIVPIAVLGAGVGFLVWHNFGEVIVRDTPDILASWMMGRLPTDVWQPEGFVFSSMLTNSLFIVSLCLIAGIVLALLDAKTGWRPVAGGALMMLVLMNIHSYDVLLLLLVAIAFLAMSIAAKRMTGAWFARCAVIFAGAIPSALWFLHVLRNDPVFQARAAVFTYSPNFRQVVFGYLLLVAFGLYGIIRKARLAGELKPQIGSALYVGLVAFLFKAAEGHTAEMFLSPVQFAVAMGIALLAAVLCAGDDDLRNWLIAWAFIGLIALYVPAAFQRKLAMALSVPWALLAGLAIHEQLQGWEKGRRTLLSAFAIVLLGFSSVLWLQRELGFIKARVTRTTVHPLYLTHDMQQIVRALNERSGERRVVLAIPGVWNQLDGQDGMPGTDQFGEPLIPDLNPILSGLTGCYTYAGHWGETPDYGIRRRKAGQFFYKGTSEAERNQILDEGGIQYVVGPVFSDFGAGGESAYIDLTTLGEVLVDGATLKLVKVR